MSARSQTPQRAQHDFHASLTEVHYNPKAGAFEVSLRVFLDDLQLALTQSFPGQDIEVSSRRSEPLLLAYLNRHFQVRDAHGRSHPLSVVGMEQETDVAWLYLEVSCPQGYQEAMIRNSILTDIFEDQQNLLNVQVGSKKQSFLLTRDQPTAQLTN